MLKKSLNLCTLPNCYISNVIDQLLIRSKLNNNQCYQPQYSTTPVQNVVNNSAELTTDKSPYPKYLSWTDPHELAHYLSQRIVALTKHFVVIDKPPNLSVWGHSLASREAISMINPKLYNASDLGINDCLPQLNTIITSLEREQQDTPNDNSSNSCGSIEIPKLYIIESLPAAYSGLILLGRNEKYTNAARKFYKTAMLGGSPWELYQKLLIVCWGKPQQIQSKPTSFPIAAYALHDHLRVGYRPSPNGISKSLKLKGVILEKSVHHTILSEGSENSSLVKLETNSLYRGLPEVYLLYEGCTVVGETFQASRLVNTGISPIVLPPNKIRLNYSIPLKQRRILGQSNINFEDIPVHIHRSHLYLPIPFYMNASNLCIKSYVKKPSHLFKIKSESFSLKSCNISSKPSPLSLSCVKQEVDSDTILTTKTTTSNNNSNNRTINYYFLTCHSYELPDYFSNTLARLGIEFDYANWLEQNIINNNNDKIINKIT
ncbi:unnamed protein product [Schistosoma curassoni]|nr:unnamed protein product [Schistosoma curassoni]